MAEEILGLSVEVVRKPPKPIREKVARGCGPRSRLKKAERSIGKGLCTPRAGGDSDCYESRHLRI
jgi:hypothetical protein